MNDALMVGIVLTLVFGAIIFFLYNRLTLTERKMGLFEGVLTDLKIMMDSAPFASGPPPMHEFDPTPEYLNAMSGPLPIQKDEMEEVDPSEQYQQTLEQALESAATTDALEANGGDESFRTLQVHETHGSALAPQSAINVTKLSPDLESMTVKELIGLAKQRGVSVPAATRRKEIIELLKKSSAGNMQGVADVNAMLDGPELEGGASLEESDITTVL